MPKTFVDVDNEEYIDEMLEDLNISRETLKILKQNDVEYLSKLSWMNEDAIRKMDSMNSRALREILSFKQNYVKSSSGTSNTISLVKPVIEEICNPFDYISDESTSTTDETVVTVSKADDTASEVRVEQVVTESLTVDQSKTSIPNPRLQDSVDTLNLSVRSKHALDTNGVKTIAEFLELTKDVLLTWRNIGAKSANEIIDKVNELKIKYDMVEEKQIITFKRDGVTYIDIPITEDILSVRSYNGLINAGYTHLSQLLDLTIADLKCIKNLGFASVNEITDLISNTKFSEITDLISNTKFSEITLNIDENVINELEKLASTFIKNDNVNSIILKALYRAYDKCKSIDEDAIVKEFIKEDVVKDYYKNILLKEVSSSEYGVEFNSIQKLFPDVLIENGFAVNLLNELIADKAVRKNKLKLYEKYVITVEEYMRQTGIKDIDLARQRISGLTLEDLGNMYNLTRERIRQREGAFFRRMPHVEEDMYKYIFSTYRIDLEMFQYGFLGDEFSYNYLSLRYSQKVKMDDLKSLSEIVNDANLPVRVKEAGIRAYNKYLDKTSAVLDNERVPLNKVSIVTHFLKLVTKKDTIAKNDFIEQYNSYVDSITIPNEYKMEPGFRDSIKISDDRYLDHIYEGDKSICSGRTLLRYYDLDINNKNYQELVDTINWDSYNNKSISSLVIFREYGDLMKKYDIRNENELHNLLRKIANKYNLDFIRFGKMPTLEFGKCDKEKQIVDLLINLSPVSKDDLAAKYEDLYGVSQSVVLGNYFKYIYQYSENKTIYNYDVKTIDQNEIDALKPLLVDDFYTFDEISEIYRNNISNQDLIINKKVLKDLGFIGYANYAVSEKYQTSSNYFESILSNSYIDYGALKKDIPYNNLFNNILADFKANNKIFKYDNGQYINIKELESNGYSLKDIDDFVDKLRNFNTEKFFTIESIKDEGFYVNLFDMIEGDMFYASVLEKYSDEFSLLKLANVFVISKEGNFDLSDFIAFIIEKEDVKSININDLQDILKDRYRMVVDQYKIYYAIDANTSEEKPYRDYINGRIYKNRKVYEEFLNEIFD